MTPDRARFSQAVDLPNDWFAYVLADNVSEALPGIYEWLIEGVGCYIGKYTHIDRPKLQYARNVSNLLSGLDYRRSNPKGFRRIHRELAEHAGKVAITLTILENVDPASLNSREREIIEQRRREAEAGGLKILNSN